jgi:ABC-type hemin transport system ATPase subunit
MMREMAGEGRAVMVITHDTEFAARVADRYAVLEEGRIVASGEPWEVFSERPVYAPLMWKTSEGLDLELRERPITPSDLVPAVDVDEGVGAI